MSEDMPVDTTWMNPSPVSAVDLAFPARGVELAPPWDEIPQPVDPRWLKIQNLWFYNGLPPNIGFCPKAGIDPEAAFNHLKVVQGCYGLKHEHKVDAVAYLGSLWFDEIVTTDGDKPARWEP